MSENPIALDFGCLPSLVRVRDTECENGIMMMEEEEARARLRKEERRDFG